MKQIYMTTLLGTLLLAAGCTTSSQVQELIDTSYKDSLAKSAEHDSSIDVLKKSSMTTLQQNEEQAASLVSLQKQVDEAMAKLKTMQGNTEAAKVMSAANTVQVAELDESIQVNKVTITETGEKMASIDTLFEGVMIGHYEKIAESAKNAISALQADDVSATNEGPAGLAEPIEIVAPDTSAPTNAAPNE